MSKHVVTSSSLMTYFGAALVVLLGAMGGFGAWILREAQAQGETAQAQTAETKADIRRVEAKVDAGEVQARADLRRIEVKVDSVQATQAQLMSTQTQILTELRTRRHQ